MYSMKNTIDLFDLNQRTDNKYTCNIAIPQYAPSAEKPSMIDLYSRTKYDKLVQEINVSSLSEDDKQFLRMAATRHIIFNYSRIADYYAHASKEMQDLMEKSALVIIDFDDAIANGYVRLSKNIEKIMQKTGRLASTSNRNE